MQIYDKTAKKYDELVTPCRVCQFLTLAHELQLKGDEKILEVGSGPGVLAQYLAQMLPTGEVVGLDLSNTMVELSKEKAKGVKNLKFVLGNALYMQFSDNSFDAVVTVHVLPWVSDPKTFLSEIHRVLKKGGKIGIITWAPSMYNEFGLAFKNAMSNYGKYYGEEGFKAAIGAKMYTEQELEELMRSAGFEVNRNFTLQIREPLTPQKYVERVETFSGGRYLEQVFERDWVRQEIKKELSKMDSKATECGMFVIGTKR